MLKQLGFRTWVVDLKNGGFSEIGDVLTNHHPSMGGWTSEKFSLFPQTLIFQVASFFNVYLTDSDQI